MRSNLQSELVLFFAAHHTKKAADRPSLVQRSQIATVKKLLAIW
ncbi:hypothetical protein [Pseudomonas sp. LPB0260]|nr:hypothetical protein [Pseudomonas sp. LPB0260]